MYATRAAVILLSAGVASAASIDPLNVASATTVIENSSETDTVASVTAPETVDNHTNIPTEPLATAMSERDQLQDILSGNYTTETDESANVTTTVTTTTSRATTAVDTRKGAEPVSSARPYDTTTAAGADETRLADGVIATIVVSILLLSAIALMIAYGYVKGWISAADEDTPPDRTPKRPVQVKDAKKSVREKSLKRSGDGRGVGPTGGDPQKEPAQQKLPAFEPAPVSPAKEQPVQLQEVTPREVSLQKVLVGETVVHEATPQKTAPYESAPQEPTQRNSQEPEKSE